MGPQSRLLVRVCLAAILSFAFAEKMLAKEKDAPKELPFPSESQSTDAPSRGVTAMHQKDGKILALPEGKAFVMVSKFDPLGTSREKVFTPLVSMERLNVVKDDATAPDWRGMDQTPERQLFFDGRELAWTESDPKTMAEILRRSVPWDMIRPPRDSRGEPTTVETKALRAKLRKVWTETMGLKVSGIVRIPKSWGNYGGNTPYLLVSRLKGFPLMLMECDPKEPSLCQITRHCYLEGASQLAHSSVTGLAVNQKTKIIYIGDSKNHMIHGFKFSSCYHVPRVSRMALPQKMKTISNLFVDEDERLWVTTSMPDDYLNASIYFWPPGFW